MLLYVNINLYYSKLQLQRPQKESCLSISTRMIKQLTSHPYFKNYVIYCIGFILLGNLMIALGPLIPYLSEQQGRLETQYSVYFLARALGFVTGALSIKITQGYFTYHQLLAIGYCAAGIFSIAANQIQYKPFCVVYFFIASAGFCYMDLFGNIATINSFKGENLDKWLQFLHGCFGVGGLMGPYIIFLLEFKAFTVLGILTILLSVFILRLKSPQLDSNQPSLSIMQGDDDMQADLKQAFNKSKPNKYISKKCTYIMCFSFLLLVGQQASYGSWIPSFAVMKGYSTKEHATIYSSLYWFSITFFRFAFLLLPGTIKSKIYWLVGGGIAVSALSLVFIEMNSQLGLNFASLAFGLCNSALFPLLLSLPTQYGLLITPHENSYFMLFAALGEGTVSVATGYIMKIFGPETLFITMGLMNLVGTINHSKICSILSGEGEKRVELKQMTTKKDQF